MNFAREQTNLTSKPRGEMGVSIVWSARIENCGPFENISRNVLGKPNFTGYPLVSASASSALLAVPFNCYMASNDNGLHDPHFMVSSVYLG